MHEIEGETRARKFLLQVFFPQFIFIQNVNGAISEQPQFGARATNRGIFQTRRKNSQTICTILPTLTISLEENGGVCGAFTRLPKRGKMTLSVAF